jgi:hypothetical protein
MTFETVKFMPLRSGHLALQREKRVPQGYDDVRSERVVYVLDGITMTIADLSVLEMITRMRGINLIDEVAGQETTFADIVAPLLNVAYFITPHLNVYRMGWLLERNYGIDLDRYPLRVEGTRLLGLGRMRDAGILLQPGSIGLDLITLAYSVEDMTNWAEKTQHDPPLRLPRGQLVRIQEPPFKGRHWRFPQSSLVYITEGVAHPVTNLQQLSELTNLRDGAIRGIVYEHPVAFARIVCAMYDLRLLTPGWRHLWLSTFMAGDIHRAWLTLKGDTLQMLAYPVEEPGCESYPLSATFYCLSINLVTLEQERHRLST